MSHLLEGLFSSDDLRRYTIRQGCGPQPAMRRVEQRGRSFLCFIYEQHEWLLKGDLPTRLDAITFWLGDPWLPPNDRGYADATAAQSTLVPEWTPRQWGEAVEALSFYIVTETGARPHEVGPNSQWTSGRVYQRLKEQRAAAHIYWSEGRRRLDDLRAECPVRSDLPDPLRCVALAETAVLLMRRPHQESYVYVHTAPAGVAGEAAQILRRFNVPARTMDLLIR